MSYANRVAELAREAPDSYAKSRLYRAAGDLRRHYGFSDDDKRKLVLSCLKHGCSTYEDIANETGFVKPVVQETISQLRDLGFVSVTTLLSSERGGRPSLFLTLLEVESAVK